jgi:hypothetical protein
MTDIEGDIETHAISFPHLCVVTLVDHPSDETPLIGRLHVSRNEPSTAVPTLTVHVVLWKGEN